LFESRLLPEPIGTEEDHRLPEWGFGITNLVPRATPGIDTLRPTEYVAGARALRRKVRRWKPDVVAFVGVTLFRAVFAVKPRVAIPVGLQPEAIGLEGARVFVLPNPSGRNANFSYQEMLKAFTGLRRWIASTKRDERLGLTRRGCPRPAAR
jgi:TDG/mug DNA glycosylase family protein